MNPASCTVYIQYIYCILKDNACQVQGCVIGVAMDEDAAAEAAEQVSCIMKRELSWSEERRKNELVQTEAFLESCGLGLVTKARGH